MTNRTYRIKHTKTLFGQVVFPLDNMLAIYARQSRGEQVENNPESFQQQTQRLLEIAIELGWLPDHILKFVENQQVNGIWKNASGTKRMDERPQLQKLVGCIERDEVKAVLVWLVDRLFRDEDRAEAPVFARLCKDHQCIVITNAGEVFDFSKSHDYDRFIQDAWAGGDFITKHLKGRALPARRQVALRGEYDGRSLSVGYIVERKQKGIARKLQIWEPHAEVVRWIFKRYRELSGNFASLSKEMAAMPFHFSFFPEHMYVPKITLKHNEHGYIISENGLRGLLTNPVYIGYWYVKDAPVRKDNHPAIIDEETFWFAFDRLSPIDIDGNPNEQKAQRARYNKVGTVPVDALLNGIVTSDTANVYVQQYADRTCGAFYTMYDTKKYYGNSMYGSIQVKKLDTILTNHLLARLEHGKTISLDDWFTLTLSLDNVLAVQFEEVAKQYIENTAGLTAKIAEHTEEAESLDRTLHFGAKSLDGATIEKYSARLANLHRSIDILKAKIKRTNKIQEDLAEFSDGLQDIPAIWHKMGIEKQQRFLRIATHAITLTKVAPSWMKVEIEWLWPDTPNSVCYISQRKQALLTETDRGFLESQGITRYDLTGRSWWTYTPHTQL